MLDVDVKELLREIIRERWLEESSLDQEGFERFLAALAQRIEAQARLHLYVRSFWYAQRSQFQGLPARHRLQQLQRAIGAIA